MRRSIGAICRHVAGPLLLYGAITACAPLPVQPPPDGIGTLHTAGASVFVNQRPAVDGQRIRNRDFVSTGAASHAQVTFDSGGYVLFGENTDPELEQRETGPGQCIIEFFLSFGTVAGESGRCSIQALTAFMDTLIFSTYYIEARPQETVVTLLDGRAEIVRPIRQTVRPREQVTVTSRGRILGPTRISPAESRRILEWIEQRRLAALTVPALEGLDIKAAEATLARRGLSLGRVSQRPTRDARAGTVIAQKPLAGTPVDRGLSVDLTVARTPAAVSIGVPRLRGLDVDSALATLAKVGLRPGVLREEQTARFRPGTVIGQNPPAGSSVRPEATVDLVVAVAPTRTDLRRAPALIGLALKEAEDRLRRFGLRLGEVVEERTRRAKAGTVIGQNPVTGTAMRPGAPVDLVIARTPAPVQVQPRSPAQPQPAAPSGLGLPTFPAVPIALPRVPNLTGQSLAQAREALARAGYRLGQVTERVTGRAKVGTVTSQSPRAGTQIQAGTSVDLVVEGTLR